MKITKDQWMYIGVFAVIAVMCIVTLACVSGDFGGSDDAGGDAAADWDYEPWTGDLFETIGFEMPGETESLLFAVQAAIGAFIIGYFVGVNSGKKKALAGDAAASCECEECECGKHGEDCECGKCVEAKAADAEEPAAEEPEEAPAEE